MAVASVSQRVGKRVAREQRQGHPHAIDEYQGSYHDATTTHANVSAQVAATTVGTSGDSRLYRYQASSSISGGHAKPMILVIIARLSGQIARISGWCCKCGTPAFEDRGIVM